MALHLTSILLLIFIPIVLFTAVVKIIFKKNTSRADNIIFGGVLGLFFLVVLQLLYYGNATLQNLLPLLLSLVVLILIKSRWKKGTRS
ncbi:hypothetical protein MH117_05140 [Paenibacillus sp. ACRRX]|uniref:hypothetical protein n=1 Tax=Paenibacillus sp. ACRRX TaxID=2918206 RepID=UPI001EF5EF42|nr:hypothetical protein [Paenibacillus sp. ACRRX]MCG7406796.1 hypothetical protein [Paenibacillus sp. ACRRX]